MSRIGKINWKRLWWAIKEVGLKTIAMAILFGLFFLPGLIALLTGYAWWFILYPILYFIIETWEKYNGR